MTTTSTPTPLTWTKVGRWTTQMGPGYRSADGRAYIGGEYGTLGNNGKGWRKTRCYVLFLDHVQVDSGTSLRRLQRVAARRVQVAS